jgi:acylaminoacyl-peptidase
MFSVLHSFFVSQGYAVLLVNYRGSLGFGEDALRSLPGRVGTADVQDCVDATRAVMERQPPVVDGTKVGVVGGSHGGFLTGHLLGQHPNLFKVCLLVWACVCVSLLVSACVCVCARVCACLCPVYRVVF